MPRWLLVALGIGAAICGPVLIAIALIALILGQSALLPTISILLGFVFVAAALFVGYKTKFPN